MSDERLLVGLLGVIAVGVSFALTVLFFGLVVLAGVLLTILGLALLGIPGRRQTAVLVLGASAATLSGPFIYIGLALLQAL